MIILQLDGVSIMMPKLQKKQNICNNHVQKREANREIPTEEYVFSSCMV